MFVLWSAPPLLMASDRIEADVTIRATNVEEEIDLRSDEKWVFAVEPSDPATLRMSLSRTLMRTRFNDAEVPGPKASRVTIFVLSSTGELRYRPFATTQLDGRLFRLFEAWLPRDGSPPASRTRVAAPASLPDHLPASTYERQRAEDCHGAMTFPFTYRESEVSGSGSVRLDPLSGWPLSLNLRLKGLALEGGTERVTTEFTMVPTKLRLRGVDVPVGGADSKTRAGVSYSQM